MMAITGQAATGPRPAGASVIDHHGAALFALGIVAAIVRRQRTGQGCRVDASLMQSALDLQAESLVAWINAPVKPPGPQAFRHVAGWYYAAPYGVYATRDGHLAISLSPLAVLGRGRRRAAARHLYRQGHLDEAGRDQRSDRAAGSRRRPPPSGSRAWSRSKIWHAPVQGYAEIVDDPQVKHMKSLVTVAGAGETGAPVTLVNHPVLYDGATAEVRLPPQPLGAQTAEVLKELGLARPRSRRWPTTRSSRCHADRPPCGATDDAPSMPLWHPTYDGSGDHAARHDADQRRGASLQ